MHQCSIKKQKSTKAFWTLFKSNTIGASRCPTSIESFTKTTQSLSNIRLQHLGPCLNCKFVGTKWSRNGCLRIIYSVRNAARICERVLLRGPTALSCCLLQSTQINGSLCDERSLSLTEGLRKQFKNYKQTSIENFLLNIITGSRTTCHNFWLLWLGFINRLTKWFIYPLGSLQNWILKLWKKQLNPLKSSFRNQI